MKNLIKFENKYSPANLNVFLVILDFITCANYFIYLVQNKIPII